MTGVDGGMIPRTRVVVLGGGTAGWMTAAALIRHLDGIADVHLIESAEIGIVGVGEATLPHVREFVTGLGIDEAAFMAATNATFKLGIDFQDFGAIGERYIHPFGTYGQDLAGVGFHHFWLRAQAAGANAPIGTYSMGVRMAEARRFAIPDLSDGSIASTYGYAYQFDATRFGPFLRDYAVTRGVVRTEAKVVEVIRHGDSGDVAALRLDNGSVIEGDLFVDCSGFRSLLLGETMGAAWEDWSGWLPCDRAAALPCTSPPGEIEPYTRAVAMPAGWRWRIPLQHRVGNGYVFSSSHVSEDEACAAILGAVEGKPLADPRILRFRAGRRRESWVGNVVAIGLASGFLEPLESTSIYLVQMAITRLIDLFPADGMHDADRAEFNRLVDMEYDRIRDFLILHYNATRRTDSDFWNHVRTMALPDSLADKLDLWRRAGRVSKYGEGLFFEPSWIAVYLGQGIVPDAYDPRADLPPAAGLKAALGGLEREIEATVARMPGHRAYLEKEAERLAAA
ncbi:tryptophan 7-halogenase [Sphingomonas sp. BGYR3]|uniref:tryptophan halogenase family protein n=1 Tax=Sphingomonas sp. BGYR3 TaxID=2975483 RepID=UPI0021A5FF6E|nr:tryptophan halogenase family protein [Sphingomonas sp. BGYR3]MDG5488273.1 tryptophan 7-halogenase [Sphingomonas sp. BGYR3]